MKQFKKETELAKIIIQYLQEMQWEVYQEVQISSFGSIADIVAVQNNLIWILECKLSLSLDVMAQAENWKSFANYISIVIPYTRQRAKGRKFAYQILKDYGIGCYTIQKHNKDWSSDSSISIAQPIAPKFYRKANTSYITRYLNEKQKYWAEAGNSNKLRYTPFQDTKNQAIWFVKKNSGCSFKKLIENIKHHYSSDKTAISSLRQWINQGVISELYIDKTTKEHKVYLHE